MSPERSCATCGRKIDEKSLFCPACGTRIVPAEQQKRTCPNCSAALDDVSPFCWKCGTPVASTPEGFQRAMQQHDRAAEEALGALRSNRSHRGGGLLLLVAVLLAVIVFLAAVVVVAWDTGTLPIFGSRQKALTIAGLNVTLNFDGTTTVGMIGCESCPLTVDSGGTFQMSFAYENAYGNATLHYDALIVGPGFTLSSSTPAFPFSIPPGSTVVILYVFQANAGPGAYFVPVTLNVSYSGTLS
jgi:RNA polymerase subunit RPABC4/transcription elongation factor Spt4